MQPPRHSFRQHFTAWIRHLLLAWLGAALLEYLLLGQNLQSLDRLDGIAAMSFLRLILVTLLLAGALWAISLRLCIARYERFGCAVVFAVLSAVMLSNNFSWAMLVFSALVFAVLMVYGFLGHRDEPAVSENFQKSHWVFPIITAILALAVFCVISIWTVCRVLTFFSPNYDFGIFSQMFYYMKETGLPLTTLERSGLLSHFAVHISPIYYLMLPVYWIFPHPITLQILQAVVITSAVIPMWLIGKQRGLCGLQRTLLCALLLLLPTTAGGVSYDLHENCFLLPLLLWLMYSLDRRSIGLTALFTVLTLAVKEDAAVYVAIAGLYSFVRAAANYDKTRIRELCLSAAVFCLSLVWFFLATGYLASQGDGVMTYRYNNFDYDGSGSLIAVVKAVLLCPGKLMYECTKEPDRLTYIAQTLIPLLGLPLLTRKYERYFLLIPYFLVNLMPAWQYQYNIFFQYSFGSSAFLLYLCAVNLADIRWKTPRFLAAMGAVAVSCGFFFSLITPEMTDMHNLYRENKAYYQSVSEVLEQIPDDASVTAHTFYAVPLSQREIIYDIRYCERQQLLSTDYVVVKKSSAKDFANQKLNVDGFEDLEELLLESGYTRCLTQGSLIIYKQTS